MSSLASLKMEGGASTGHAQQTSYQKHSTFKKKGKATIRKARREYEGNFQYNLQSPNYLSLLIRFRPFMSLLVLFCLYKSFCVLTSPLVSLLVLPRPY